MNAIVNRALILAAVCGASASAQSITTLYATNNNGSVGGAVYYDVTTTSPFTVELRSLDLNTTAAAGTSFGCQIYKHPGSFVGTETNTSLWTLVAFGNGVAAGVNAPSHVTLTNGIDLDPGTTSAIAIVLEAQGSSPAAAHAYTNGTGSNQTYANADVTLSLGSASNVRFTAPINTPRVWNGTLYYQIVSGACCLGDGTCLSLFESTCTAQNGVYRGDGVSCANASCLCTTLNNGGLESGTFSGWTQFGNTGSTLVNGDSVHTGHFSGKFGPVATPGGISQVIPAAAGAPLLIDFWYRSDGGLPNSFSATLGSINLASFVNDTTHGVWTEISIPVQAPTNNPILSFAFRNDPSYDYLDDVRVCVGQADCYANCDHSTTPPVLNVLDFSCFLNRFAAGCP